jgi:hypothetical protein
LIGHFEELIDDGFIVFHPDHKFLVIIKGYVPAPTLFGPIAVIELSKTVSPFHTDTDEYSHETHEKTRNIIFIFV